MSFISTAMQRGSDFLLLHFQSSRHSSLSDAIFANNHVISAGVIASICDLNRCRSKQ
jgi:hypothetical protein